MISSINGNRHNILGHSALVQCEPCTLAKSLRSSVPKRSAPRTAGPCKLLYCDIAGPLEVLSTRNCRYALAFVDDYSRTVFLYLIQKKSDAIVCLRKLRREVPVDLHGTMLQSDSDQVFRAENFRDLCADYGITQRFSPPHTQAMNGVVERAWRTVFEKTRALLFSSGLPKSYWGLALKHATLLYGITPRRSFDGVSPFERLRGSPFDTDVLREFGAPAFVHVESTGRRKLDARARKGIYVGYCAEANAHIVYLPDTKRIVNTVHCDFGPLDADANMAKHSLDTMRVDLTPLPMHLHAPPAVVPPSTATTSTSDHASPPLLPPATPTVGRMHRSKQQQLPCSPHDPLLSDFDDASDDDDHHGEGGKANVNAITTATIMVDPKNLKAALASFDSEHWRDAIVAEMTAMEALGVFEVLPRGARHAKVIGSRFVFTRKYNTDGIVIRHKVRLVAQGFTQRKDLDYDQTFAPTVTITSIRSLFAIAITRSMHVKQGDISTAYLNADLDKELCLRIPDGNGVYPEGTIVRLRRALYGLKQSGRLWNKTLNAWMLTSGFTRCETDPCMYRKATDTNHLILVAVYVDDLLVAADDVSDLEAFQKNIGKAFKMKEFDDPAVLLSIRVRYSRSEGTVTLDQEHYIRKVLDTFRMAECRPIGAPMAIGYADEKADPNTPSADVPYAELIGSLMYLATRTRPDIATALSQLSRHMQHHTDTHWVAAKHVLRYLRGTLDYRLTFNHSAALSPVAYADATYSSDHASSRSRTGFVIFMGGAPISWGSHLQKVIAQSSAESEYMGLAAATKEILFIRQLMTELIGTTLPSTLLYCDNQPATRIAERSATKMRHIRIRFHTIRQCVEQGLIHLEYVPTHTNVADLFTKALGKPKTLQFCEMLFTHLAEHK